MINWIITYASFSHLIIFTLTFLLLTPVSLKKNFNMLIFLLFFFFALYISQFSTSIDTLSLFIGFFLLSFITQFNSSTSSIIPVLFFTYLTEITIAYLTRSLLLITLSQSEFTQYFKYFSITLFFSSLLLFSLTRLIKYWFLPYLKKSRYFYHYTYLQLLLLLLYQAYILINYHSDGNPFIILLILIFYIIFGLLIVLIQQISAKNHALQTLYNKQQLEKELILTYAEESKKHYQSIKHFRHDYLNILASIGYYIEKNKMSELKLFYEEKIQPTKNTFKNQLFEFHDLEKIRPIEIRSILMIKIMNLNKKNIKLHLEVSDDLPENVEVDSVILIRIIGILLDNAIEELESLSEGQLSIGIFHINCNWIFIIQNTTGSKVPSLHQIQQAGFSTKGQNRGLGLQNIKLLMALEPKLYLETIIKPDLFVQKVTINGGD